MCTFWGMSLRTAGLVIGYVELASAVLASLLTFILMNDMENMVEYVRSDLGDSDISEETIRLWATVYFSILLVALIFNIITSIILLIGIYKDRSVLLMPWLIESAITIVWSIISIIVFLVMGSSSVFNTCLTTLLEIWFFRVIYVLYKSMASLEAQNSREVGYVATPKV